MDQFSFSGKRVTVYGLGISGGGVGTVEFLAKRGAKEIIVTDSKSESELASSVAKIRDLPGVTLSLGSHRREDFTDVDLVIKNPRILWTNEYIRLAQDANVPVEMDSGIFFALCLRPIIGVTGTKGKTTTATAIAHLLRSAGHSVLEVGVSDRPVLSLLDEVRDDTVVVFELSSWRLSGLRSVKKSPHIAVFTNFFPDHLNYYESMEEYFSDKANIFCFQREDDTFVYHASDARLREAAASVFSSLFPFSAQDAHRDGIFFRGEDIIVRKDEQENVVAKISDIRIPGEHARLNMLAAIAATSAYGVSMEHLSDHLSSFTGVPHRLEYVGEKKGIRWYNDTAATVPDAAIAGMRSFDEPLILLGGGSDKNLSFDEMGRYIAETSNVLGVVLFSGDASEKLVTALRSYNGDKKMLGMVSSMKEAINLVLSRENPPKIALLSPGSASFGIFKNEFDRGDQFREQVEDLSSIVDNNSMLDESVRSV